MPESRTARRIFPPVWCNLPKWGRLHAVGILRGLTAIIILEHNKHPKDLFRSRSTWAANPYGLLTPRRPPPDIVDTPHYHPTRRTRKKRSVLRAKFNVPSYDETLDLGTLKTYLNLESRAYISMTQHV